MSPDSENMLTTRLADLEAHIGRPVILIASGWRGDIATNLDVDAGRVFVEVLEQTLSAGDAPVSEVALVLAGVGGFPEFADSARRALRGRSVDYKALIPYRVNAALSVLALGASEIILHPYAGLGARDASPLGRNVTTNWAVVNHLTTRVLSPRETAERARIADALTADRLGEAGGLDAVELAELGLPARVAAADAAAALWNLYCFCEEALQLREAPERRFTESEVNGEVEFEMAALVCGAFIASTACEFRLELDTGRPDPDTGMLDGAWSKKSGL